MGGIHKILMKIVTSGYMLRWTLKRKSHITCNKKPTCFLT